MGGQLLPVGMTIENVKPIIDPPIFCVFTESDAGVFNILLAKAINLFEGGKVRVNHAAFVYWSAEWAGWRAIGANANGVTEVPLKTFAATRAIPYVFAPVGFNLWDGMRAHAADVGKHYNYSGLAGMAFVEIARKLKMHPKANLLSDNNDLFCSQWQAEIVSAAITHAMLSENLSAMALLLRTWPLLNTDADVIDPALLCRTELKSHLFAQQHSDVFESAWRIAA